MFGTKEIDAEGLTALIENGEKLKIIDVRSHSEYIQGTIKGSEFMPLHTVPLHLNELPKEGDGTTLVFICSSGNRSAQACAYVKQQTGLESYNLAGGLMRWYRSGFPLVRPDLNVAQV
ncbi:MAG TPA: rhodanese-like domain-containing protein [Thiothrix sp.]|nr:rhodanese-like domain-containing protein [Thiothrix sp.]